jgi:hypothetical protein
MVKLIAFCIGVRALQALVTAFLHGIMVAKCLGIDVITHRTHVDIGVAIVQTTDNLL